MVSNIYMCLISLQTGLEEISNYFKTFYLLMIMLANIASLLQKLVFKSFTSWEPVPHYIVYKVINNR